jgi:DNA-binding transcriptional LysR family regulator
VEIRQLRYFVALARELHFRRAADQLRIAQPSLSNQLQRLEDEVDARLVHRTKRRVQLTEAGRVFLGEAQRILTDVERLVRLTRLANRGAAGELMIGCTPAAELSVLPRVLPLFKARCPTVAIRIESLSTAAQLEALRNRALHVGFFRLPCDEQPELLVQRVLQEPLVVVLPSKHPLSSLRTIPFRRLAGQPYISFPRRAAPALYDSILAHCRTAGFSLDVVIEVETFQMQQSLVALGFGITLHPASIQSISRHGIVYRPLTEPVLQLEMGMAYHRSDEPSELLREFLSAAHEALVAAGRRGQRRRRRRSKEHRSRGDWG